MRHLAPGVLLARKAVEPTTPHRHGRLPRPHYAAVCCGLGNVPLEVQTNASVGIAVTTILGLRLDSQSWSQLAPGYFMPPRPEIVGSAHGLGPGISTAARLKSNP